MAANSCSNSVLCASCVFCPCKDCILCTKWKRRGSVDILGLKMMKISALNEVPQPRPDNDDEDTQTITKEAQVCFFLTMQQLSPRDRHNLNSGLYCIAPQIQCPRTIIKFVLFILSLCFLIITPPSTLSSINFLWMNDKNISTNSGINGCLSTHFFFSNTNVQSAMYNEWKRNDIVKSIAF